MNKIPVIVGEALLQFIPQRHPFVMVDKLFAIAEKSVEAGLTVTQDNLLVENGKLQASGMIEHMAQTCALFAGYKANEVGNDAPVGFIASIKDVVIKALPDVGESIFSTIEIVNELMNMQIARALVHNESGEVIGGCELRIFIKEEE